MVTTVKEEERHDGPLFDSTSASTSASPASPAKYALHIKLPAGDFFTSAVDLHDRDVVHLDTGLADVISVAPSALASLSASMPPPHLGSRVHRHTSLKRPRHSGWQGVEPNIASVRHLYYSPYASFAPTYDSAQATLGLEQSLEMEQREEKRRKVLDESWGRPRGTLGEGDDDDDDEVVVAPLNRRASRGSTEETMTTAPSSLAGLESYHLRPPSSPSPAAAVDSTPDALDLAGLESAGLESAGLESAGLDPALLTSGLRDLDREERTTARLADNAAVLRALQEWQTWRLREGRGSLAPGEAEKSLARTLSRSLAHLLAERPRSAITKSGTALPPPSALRSTMDRLLIPGASYWGGIDSVPAVPSGIRQDAPLAIADNATVRLVEGDATDVRVPDVYAHRRGTPAETVPGSSPRGERGGDARGAQAHPHVGRTVGSGRTGAGAGSPPATGSGSGGRKGTHRSASGLLDRVARSREMPGGASRPPSSGSASASASASSRTDSRADLSRPSR